MKEHGSRRKRISKRSIMRRVRINIGRKKSTDASEHSSSAESNDSNTQRSPSDLDDDHDMTNSYSIIHVESLLSFLKRTVCAGCESLWQGEISMKRREGLYTQFQFKCMYCGSINDLCSSPLVPNSQRREINTRLAIGTVLSGVSYGVMIRLLGALNLPPPVEENRFTRTQEFMLDYVSKAQDKSMFNAVETAVASAKGIRELTVSGDGAWLTRGHSSIHGIAALCSTTPKPKVLDVSSSSKCCTKCHGAQSLRSTDPDLYEIHQKNHECQLNYSGK